MRYWLNIHDPDPIGHDLGHPPYGHTGEAALDELSQKKKLGRFFHEAHSLRVFLFQLL